MEIQLILKAWKCDYFRSGTDGATRLVAIAPAIDSRDVAREVNFDLYFAKETFGDVAARKFAQALKISKPTGHLKDQAGKHLATRKFFAVAQQSNKGNADKGDGFGSNSAPVVVGDGYIDVQGGSGDELELDV